jgi:hypothetical protein
MGFPVVRFGLFGQAGAPTSRSGLSGHAMPTNGDALWRASPAGWTGLSARRMPIARIFRLLQP